MKILVANYRYFISGGPERYMFNVIDALGGRGHEIVPFSVRYTRNQATPFDRYFVAPLGSADEVRFGDQRPTPGALWRTMVRLFYAPDVQRAVQRLVADTRPEVAYVLHYLRKLSPSLLVGLKAAGVPIVVRLSDYGMLCPEQHCLRDGVACELCVGGSLLPSIRYGCVQGSRVASGLNAAATWYHRRRRYFDLIDVFVTTTQFMYRKMVAAGVPEHRLRCIPTSVDGRRFHPRPDFAKSAYIAFGGRLEAIKGVHVLIDALARLRRTRPDLPLQVKIAGGGDEQYSAQLRQRVRDAGLDDAVEFVGELDTPALSDLLSGALVSVVPSICYENLPNAALESYACGTPVVASDHGALTECVANGETGYRFPPGDARGLADAIERCLDRPDDMRAMGRRARQAAETTYSPERHIEALEALFTELRAHRPAGYDQSR
ncbi:MAG TPA: glycosyltransferase family 4 protein [Candidatus Acidoferrales bacterium]|nr:glycosyltransferase family 4 protein [Candidatus Acidoferrales bacterium]